MVCAKLRQNCHFHTATWLLLNHKSRRLGTDCFAPNTIVNRVINRLEAIRPYATTCNKYEHLSFQDKVLTTRARRLACEYRNKANNLSTFVDSSDGLSLDPILYISYQHIAKLLQRWVREWTVPTLMSPWHRLASYKLWPLRVLSHWYSNSLKDWKIQTHHSAHVHP